MHFQNVMIGSGAHPPSCPVTARALSLGVKQLECEDTDLSSATADTGNSDVMIDITTTPHGLGQ